MIAAQRWRSLPRFRGLKMQRRRVVSSAEEARTFLAAIDAAGGDVRAWALANGIDGRSLNGWRRRLSRPVRARARRKRKETGSNGIRLVELVPATTVASPSRYSLELRGVRVEFCEDFSESTLRRIIGVLKSC
jgi:hypothetical protein